jgi:AraC family transcriptional regulator, carnitine catabolism transcriptional activator
MSAVTSDPNASSIGFLVLPAFPIYALILATESLRVANQHSGHRLFNWHMLSVAGGAVRAGSGAMIAAEASIRDVTSLPTVIVCAGNRPTQDLTRPLLGWLRRLARQGTTMGAIDTGVFALAAAGLLDGRRVTLHWDAIQTFREQFPEIDVVEQLFVSDRNRLTCAGGIATLDMMLHLISRQASPALAQIIANGFVYERIRPATDPQRRAGGNRELETIIRRMEDHIDDPLSRVKLARDCGMSTRQLERLVRRHLGDSPMKYYLKIRLQAARNLLFYTDRPVQEIALASGFSSSQLFSRSFHALFRLSPREFRHQYRGERLLRFRAVNQLIGLDAAPRTPTRGVPAPAMTRRQRQTSTAEVLTLGP